MATAQTGTTDVEPASEEEYDLSITTDQPADVRETEADFQATVDQLDPDFDAALVYWNYSQDSSLDQKGPANIVLENNFEGSETVESLQPNLDTDTGYDVEAYAEPIVWDDDTLVDNFIEKGLEDEERSWGDADQDSFVDNAGVMEAVADSSVAMEAVADSEAAVQSITVEELPYQFSNAEAYYDSEDNGLIEIERSSEESTTGFVGISQDLNLSNQDTMYIYAKADTFGANRNRMRAKVRIDGNTELSLRGDDNSFVEREVDVSDYDGRHSIELGYESTSFGGTSNYIVRLGRFYFE